MCGCLFFAVFLLYGAVGDHVDILLLVSVRHVVENARLVDGRSSWIQTRTPQALCSDEVDNPSQQAWHQTVGEVVEFFFFWVHCRDNEILCGTVLVCKF